MYTRDTIENFNSLRHRWEMPLIWTSTILTMFSIAFGAVILIADEAVLSSYLGESTDSVVEYAQFALSVTVLPLAIFIVRYYMAARAKSNAIRVGPNQLPELWTIYENLASQLKMKWLPKFYVTNGNGVVNAYALSCNSRHKYIVIHSEIAMLVKQTPEAVEFVLAHELAHHKLGHTSLWRTAMSIIPNTLVLLGISTTRAQEYSADRVALSLCQHHQSAMNLLAVGPWMQNEINAQAWNEQCDTEQKEFYVRIANLLSNHAVLVKRSKALKDFEQMGIKSHGSMF